MNDIIARLAEANPVPINERQEVEYALANLGGCWGKLDDARHNRYGMTWERAGRDSVDVLAYHLLGLCRALGVDPPVGLQ